MCEPHHSIVQYPNDDDDGNPTQSRLQMGLKKLYDFGRKVGRYFHLSKLGSGHSESQLWANTNSLILPNNVYYEGNWWERSFHIDEGFGWLRKKDNLFQPGCEQEAVDAAKLYHDRVVFQNIQSFRRFLEDSMKESERPFLYLERFKNNVLNPQGQTEFESRLKHFSQEHRRNLPKWLVDCKDQAIKCIMGLTRKREWFRSHFADDNTLWLPRKEGIVLS